MTMGTEKRYIHKRISICRACKGTGKIVTFDRLDILRRNPKSFTCTQCGGTGRVVIQGETTINVEPFNPDRDG